MEAFFTSTVLVAIAEIGDKTQLLSFVLAAKLRRPYPIMAGIFTATLLNHALAASVGAWLAGLIPSHIYQLDCRVVVHWVRLVGAQAGHAGGEPVAMSARARLLPPLSRSFWRRWETKRS